MRYKMRIFDTNNGEEVQTVEDWVNEMAKEGYTVQSIVSFPDTPDRFQNIFVTLEIYDDAEDDEDVSSISRLLGDRSPSPPDSSPTSLDPIDDDYWKSVIETVDSRPSAGDANS